MSKRGSWPIIDSAARNIKPRVRMGFSRVNQATCWQNQYCTFYENYYANSEAAFRCVKARVVAPAIREGGLNIKMPQSAVLWGGLIGGVVQHLTWRPLRAPTVDGRTCTSCLSPVTRHALTWCVAGSDHVRVRHSRSGADGGFPRQSGRRAGARSRSQGWTLISC